MTSFDWLVAVGAGFVPLAVMFRMSPVASEVARVNVATWSAELSTTLLTESAVADTAGRRICDRIARSTAIESDGLAATRHAHRERERGLVRAEVRHGTSLIVYVVLAPKATVVAASCGPAVPTVTALEDASDVFFEVLTLRWKVPVLEGASALKSTSTF